MCEKLPKQGAGVYEPPSRLDNMRKLIGYPVTAAPAAKTTPKLPPVETRVKLLENSRMVEIVCSSPDPRYAASFADTLASEYVDYNMEALWQSSQKTSDWLTRQLQDLRNKLEQSENQLQAYSRDSGLVITGPDQNIDDEGLKNVQRELSAAQADRISKQSALRNRVHHRRRIRSPRSWTTGVSAIIRASSPTCAANTRNRAPSIRRRIRRCSRSRRRSRISRTRSKRERANIVSRIQNDYQAALKRERMLQVAYTAQMQRVHGSIAQIDLLRHPEARGGHQPPGLRATPAEGEAGGIGAALQPTNVSVVDAGRNPGKAVQAGSFRNSPYGARVRPRAGFRIRHRRRV